MHTHIKFIRELSSGTAVDSVINLPHRSENSFHVRVCNYSGTIIEAKAIDPSNRIDKICKHYYVI